MNLLVCRRQIEQVMELQVPERRSIVHGGNRNPWKLLDTDETVFAFYLLYEVPAGYSFKDLEEHIDALGAALGKNLVLRDYKGGVLITVYKNPLKWPLILDSKIIEAIDQLNPWEILLGFDIHNQPITKHMRKPHMMVSGETGMGKTELLRLALFQLIRKYTPDQLQIFIVDLKEFSFLPFEKCPHVTIATDLNSGKIVLEKVVKELNRRKKMVHRFGRNACGKLPLWWVIIDEAASVSKNIVKKKEEKKIAELIEWFCSEITRVGREPRVGLWYCTQYPNYEAVSQQVKNNLVDFLSFHVATPIAAVVSGCVGADKIPSDKPGRAMMKGYPPIELQVPYLPPLEGDYENDGSWDEYIKPYQGEWTVLENDEFEGNPNGKPEEPKKLIVSSTIPDSDYDNPTTREPLVWKFPGEKSIGTSVRTGKGKIGGRSEPGIPTQNMETDEKRPRSCRGHIHP